MTKNAHIDKYGYYGNGIGLDRKSRFPFPGGGISQNIIIFGADMSFSAHADNNKKTDYGTKIIEIEKKLTDHNHDK